jgi:hypothetical protein
MPTTSQGFENANFMGVPKTYKLSGGKLSWHDPNQSTLDFLWIHIDVYKFALI